MIRISRVEGGRPNVLFLFGDQRKARCLGCAGRPEVRRPNLGRLAREGVRFTKACTQNSICTPSRMSYLSSTCPSTHGYYDLGRARFTTWEPTRRSRTTRMRIRAMPMCGTSRRRVC